MISEIAYRRIQGITVLVLLVSPISAIAQTEEEDLAISFGNEEFVSIASGRRQHISEAPAVTSVLTAEDIKAMGARNIDEALEAIPGLHVSVTAGRYNPVYVIRGIHSNFNPQVLMLVNGIPITNFFVGDRGQIWGGMPVENVARIEVIRGPGSAIYGADAFSGVINIITKKATDINGTEVGARVGSYQTYEGWALHGGKLGGWETALSLELKTTDGQDSIIDADAQTAADSNLGTNASLAPGEVNLGTDAVDMRLDFSREEWRIRAGYQGRRNVGTGAGSAEALDPAGGGESDRFNIDLTYTALELSENWDLTAQASYFDVSNRSELVLFPPGADFTALGGGAFPDGVIGNPEVNERHARLNVSTFYTGLDNHRFRLGAGFHYGDMWKIKEVKNFTQTATGIPVPIGDLVDVSDTAPFIEEQSRTIYYAFAQDEWSMAPDWTLTAGLRYDNYSDFGDTVNPRLALVWNTTYNLTSKLLYGRAFRAPSFAEQFNINNPIALGNPDLNPEEIDTIELALDFIPTNRLRSEVNLFAYEMRDIIRFTSDPSPATTKTAQNTGDQRGHGLEWEGKWTATDKLLLLANYAYQKSTNKDTNTDAGNAPHHQFYFRADWRLSRYWNIHGQINRIQGVERVEGDDRPPPDDYTTLDLTLRGTSPVQGLDYAFSVRNLFDEDVREPSLAPGQIPNDLPRAGRSFFGELRYTW